MRLSRVLPVVVGLLLPLSVGAQTPPLIRVEMSEFAFRPATIHLTAGRLVRLELVNRGQIAHQFETAYLRTLPVRITGGTCMRRRPGSS